MGGIHKQRKGLQDLRMAQKTKLQILVRIKICNFLISTYLTIHTYSANVHLHKNPTILSTTSGKIQMVFVYTSVAQCALHDFTSAAEDMNYVFCARILFVFFGLFPCYLMFSDVVLLIHS